MVRDPDAEDDDSRGGGLGRCEGLPEEEQEKRLLRRPAAQGPGGAGFVKGMLGFNQFLRFHDFAAEGFPAPDKLDTTGRPLEETAAQVIAWINDKR